MVDISEEAVERAIETVGGFYDRNAEKGRMSAEDTAAAKARLSRRHRYRTRRIGRPGHRGRLRTLRFERRALWSSQPGHDATVVATNTSCLTVNGLAEAVNDPTRFLGLHYFNPAAINPIVEVVRGKNRARHYRAMRQFCRATSKKSILCKDSYGFALNRFFCPYSNEAVRLLEEDLGSHRSIGSHRKLSGSPPARFWL